MESKTANDARIEKDIFFYLYPKRHDDLYKTMCSQLTGSLSVIFMCLAIAGETKIRSHEISDLQNCQKILSLVANSPYLHATAQHNSTGYFCLYKEEKHYLPDPCSKFGLQAYKWLSFEEHTEQRFIQSKCNMGEMRVSSHS